MHRKELEKAHSEAARQESESKKQLFTKCAEDYIESKRHEWKNIKHGQQWENTLKTYAYPVIGELPVADIELDHILQILKPIWLTKTVDFQLNSGIYPTSQPILLLLYRVEKRENPELCKPV